MLVLNILQLCPWTGSCESTIFQTWRKALAKAQRKLASLEKGTPERRKQRKVVAKVHERIAIREKTFVTKSLKKSSIISIYLRRDLGSKKWWRGLILQKALQDPSWESVSSIPHLQSAEAGRKLGVVIRLYTQRTSKVAARLRQSPGIDDRKRVHIVNIEPFAIVDSRELSRSLAANL